MLKHYLISIGFVALLIGRAWCNEGTKFYPVDEARQDTIFTEFRDRLIQAVETRDADYVLSVIHKDIIVYYDGPSGIESFKNKCNLQKPDSKYWREMGIILNTGGSFEVWHDGYEVFWAPYVHSKWHDNIPNIRKSETYTWPADVSPDMDLGVIIGDGVALRVQPNNQADTIRMLKYDVVGAPDKGRRYHEPKPVKYPGWIRVVTYDGYYGFIPEDYYRDWFSNYMVFRKCNGQWKIVRFRAGTL